MLIKDSYSGFKCAVSIAGKRAPWFVAKRGVHQGAPFSMRLYQVFVNDLLVQLRKHRFGVYIHDIKMTCPAYADDITIMSLYKPGLIELLKVAYDYSKKWRYSYNLDKCSVIIYGKDQCPNLPITMGGKHLNVLKEVVHLGIRLSNKNDTEPNRMSASIS